MASTVGHVCMAHVGMTYRVSVPSCLWFCGASVLMVTLIYKGRDGGRRDEAKRQGGEDHPGATEPKKASGGSTQMLKCTRGAEDPIWPPGQAQLHTFLPIGGTLPLIGHTN